MKIDPAAFTASAAPLLNPSPLRLALLAGGSGLRHRGHNASVV